MGYYEEKIKTDTERLNKYISDMTAPSTYHLCCPLGAYYGSKDKHMKYAKAVGYALVDFCYDVVKDNVSSLYSRLYVKCCDLKPLLDSKEWIEGLNEGINLRLKVNSKPDGYNSNSIILDELIKDTKGDSK